jgi:succinyl-diaminopimelate desuccinylase
MVVAAADSPTMPACDLLADVAELVDIGSVSHTEKVLADRIEADLSAVPWLAVSRVGDNVVARTELGRAKRVILAGHLDTVPANGNERARIEGDTCWGLGSADMKGGLVVASRLARTLAEPAVDVTYIFYVCEEVDQIHSGLLQLRDQRPDLLAADAAILGEPTGGAVEAGCQGTLRATVTMTGRRAHTARPWMGVNAIHRLAPVLAALDAYEGRRPVIDGCEYREAIQAVRLEAGVANNVVPDRAVLTVNHRFAPDRSTDEAFDALRTLLDGSLDSAAGDEVVLQASSSPASPGLDNPLLASLVRRTGQPARAKLGWTDVAFFAQFGLPATNYGPGDPSIAHTAEERVSRSELETAYAALYALLSEGA